MENYSNKAVDRFKRAVYTLDILAVDMITRIQKWGNSLGLRLPKGVASDAGVSAGCAVDLRVENGRIIMIPLRKHRFRLEQLLSKVTTENVHSEIDMGPTTGKEQL